MKAAILLIVVLMLSPGVSAHGMVLEREEGSGGFDYEHRYLLSTGSYQFWIELYTAEPVAGVPFHLVLVPPAQTQAAMIEAFSLFAEPLPETLATPYPVQTDSAIGSNYTSGKVIFSTAGDWNLNITVSGSEGSHWVGLNMTAAMPAVFSPLVAWSVALLGPGLFVILLGIWTRRYREPTSNLPWWEEE